MNKLLALAIKIASEAFVDRVDKGGQPYILHCLFVMNEMPPEDFELRIIAVLHDFLEDTDYTAKDLYDLGFSERVVTTIQLLTHKPSDSYDFYIELISKSEDATTVKKADLKHNSMLCRLKGVTKKDLDRMTKYVRSYNYLSKV